MTHRTDSDPEYLWRVRVTDGVLPGDYTESSSVQAAIKEKKSGYEVTIITWGQMLSDGRPAGWRALTKFDGVSKIIGTLISRPGRGYNKAELADGAGISPHSAHRHLDFLTGIGVVEQVEETRPQRYRLNQSSELTRTIFKLDAQVKSAMTRLSDEEGGHL